MPAAFVNVGQLNGQYTNLRNSGGCVPPGHYRPTVTTTSLDAALTPQAFFARTLT